MQCLQIRVQKTAMVLGQQVRPERELQRHGYRKVQQCAEPALARPLGAIRITFALFCLSVMRTLWINGTGGKAYIRAPTTGAGKQLTRNLCPFPGVNRTTWHFLFWQDANKSPWGIPHFRKFIVERPLMARQKGPAEAICQHIFGPRQVHGYQMNGMPKGQEPLGKGQTTWLRTAG